MGTSLQGCYSAYKGDCFWDRNSSCSDLAACHALTRASGFRSDGAAQGTHKQEPTPTPRRQETVIHPRRRQPCDGYRRQEPEQSRTVPPMLTDAVSQQSTTPRAAQVLRPAKVATWAWEVALGPRECALRCFSALPPHSWAVLAPVPTCDVLPLAPGLESCTHLASAYENVTSETLTEELHRRAQQQWAVPVATPGQACLLLERRHQSLRVSKRETQFSRYYL